MKEEEEQKVEEEQKIEEEEETEKAEEGEKEVDSKKDTLKGEESAKVEKMEEGIDEDSDLKKGSDVDKKESSLKGKGEAAKKSEDLEASDENTSENSSMENEEDTYNENEESGSNLVEEAEEEPPKVEESLKEMDLKDVLKINSMSIDFGELFPGQILEETVIILNNLTTIKVPFKIKINCLSKEFDDLDEYVYSMRRPTTQDVFNYNDTFLILLAQKAISYYKLAIKVPNIMEEKEILGNIEISCTECQNGIITIPIKSTIG